MFSVGIVFRGTPGSATNARHKLEFTLAFAYAACKARRELVFSPL